MPFDLIEYQTNARDIWSPKRLFDLWEDVCRQKERGEIGTYEFEEMKEVIFSRINNLESARKAIEGPALGEESKDG